MSCNKIFSVVVSSCSLPILVCSNKSFGCFEPWENSPDNRHVIQRGLSITMMKHIMEGLISFFQCENKHIKFITHKIKDFEEFSMSKEGQNVMLIANCKILFANDDKSVVALILFEAKEAIRILGGYDALEMTCAYSAVFDLNTQVILQQKCLGNLFSCPITDFGDLDEIVRFE